MQKSQWALKVLFSLKVDTNKPFTIHSCIVLFLTCRKRQFYATCIKRDMQWTWETGELSVYFLMYQRLAKGHIPATSIIPYIQINKHSMTANTKKWKTFQAWRAEREQFRWKSRSICSPPNLLSQHGGSILSQHTPYKHTHTINQQYLQKILGGFRNFNIHYEDQLETAGFQFHNTTKDTHWTEGVAYDA